ncbi:monocarboxylate transporter 12-like isoform X2 [Copidosoma floridanum]|uniref:monocarboxylate transporter 12-like isoform X2 n=1 Tax=Copidosoma floridanum TaxID=29053 RepID=UPI000C6FA375|nr:monocarboxylate transporter 12-like isoform X2 [Copidosoma floridanum]
MSLPREWSHTSHAQQQPGVQIRKAAAAAVKATSGGDNDYYQAGGDGLLHQYNSSSLTTATSQEAIPNNHHGFYHHVHHMHNNAIDENMNNHNQLGSLFSIHSAPVYDNCNADSDSAKNHYLHDYRPASLVVQTTATSTPIVPPHLSPPETLDDEDNDNLLTISSLTARPLIAKSRELQGCKRTSALGGRARKKSKQPRKKKTRRQVKVSFEPLDGGYGWVVVFGAFFVQFWVAGLVKSYGVLYVEVMETFTDASASLASWVPAILSCLCLALAPVTSMLSQKYSCRKVVFVGGLFCSLGLISSYFATSLIHLLFTFGVLTGIGGGLSTTPGIILVSQYFDKHRALANGICVSGTAAGSFVFPMLIEFLVASYGFHGTLLILGGCMLHVCASASLYRPLENNHKPEEDEARPNEDAEQLHHEQSHDTRQRLEMLFVHDQTAKNNMVNELFHQNFRANELAIDLTDSEEEKDIMGEGPSVRPIPKIRSSSILHSVEDLSTDSTCFYKSRSSQRSLRSSALLVCPGGPRDSAGDVPATTASLSQPQIAIRNLTAEVCASKESLGQRIGRYIDLSLLRESRFILMCLSVSLMSTGSPYMLYYLPAYVHGSGYTKPEAGYLVAVSAVFDLCGRLGLGWLSDLQLFDRRKGYIGSIVGAGMAVLIIPLAHSFYVLAVSVGIYGLCLGCWFLLVPVLLADQYGTDKISSSYGLVRMFQSVGAITIPPLAGLMRDVTGSYNICFLFMGTCMVLGGLPLLLVSDDPKNVDEESDDKDAVKVDVRDADSNSMTKE